MTRILLMTDSTCDLPQAWIERHDIRVVPTYVHFGMESLADDGVQLTRQDFYERLIDTGPHPKTAAPPLGQVVETLRQALREADHVVAITAPALLSGIYNAFRLAAEQLDPKRVTLVDSTTLSMGTGWQIMRAIEMIQAGSRPNDIANALLALQPNIEVWAALDTLEYLRRSGRVGWATAIVGNFFQIKPIIRLHDSVVSSVTRVRTTRRAFDRLVRLVLEASPLERLAIMHTNYPQGAQRLLEALADVAPTYQVPIVEVTPVIGVHVGPNGLGVAIVRKTQ